MKRTPDLPRHSSIIETMQELRAPHPHTDDAWIVIGDPNDAGDRQFIQDGVNLQVTPNFKGAWGNVPTSSYAPLQFYLDPGGDVRFMGHVQGDVVGTEIMEPLPEGYRPEYSVTFILPNDGFGYSKVRIDPDGSVRLIEQVTI